MQKIRQGRPRIERDPETVNNINFSVKISSKLSDRIELHLSSPLSSVKSKREIFEASIVEFLDREEIVVFELEKAKGKIKKQLEVKLFKSLQD